MSHVARERLARQIAEEPSRINVMPEITIDVNVSLTEPQRMPAPLEYGTTKRGVAEESLGLAHTLLASHTLPCLSACNAGLVRGLSYVTANVACFYS